MHEGYEELFILVLGTMLMHWKKGDNELCIIAKENNNHEGCHRTPQKECHRFRLGLEFNVMGRFCMQTELINFAKMIFNYS
jgi:hypothetical protein